MGIFALAKNASSQQIRHCENLLAFVVTHHAVIASKCASICVAIHFFFFFFFFCIDCHAFGILMISNARNDGKEPTPLIPLRRGRGNKRVATPQREGEFVVLPTKKSLCYLASLSIKLFCKPAYSPTKSSLLTPRYKACLLNLYNLTYPSI